jgi:GT2 family glycosyltransferase
VGTPAAARVAQSGPGSPALSDDVLPVTVVVPTIGRVRQLHSCLESLAACRPRAVEVIVVDQSGDAGVRDLVESFSSRGMRLVACAGRGVSRGRNVGIREARNEVVLVTDDDCTVAPDWVLRGYELVGRTSGGIVTGRVLPVGDPRAVPSWKLDTSPRDYTGRRHAGALFPNNMVLHRSAVIAEGGFDERFGPDEAAEDNEFCYRWLKAGRALRYEPSLVVWHHDWRTRAELDRLYISYARGQGFFYAKHLRQSDTTMIRYMARDLYWAVRGLIAAVAKRRNGWSDPRRGILRGLPGGFVDGWRVFGSKRLT